MYLHYQSCYRLAAMRIRNECRGPRLSVKHPETSVALMPLENHGHGAKEHILNNGS